MIKVDGIDYTPEGIQELRAEVITMRNEAMKAPGTPDHKAIIIFTHIIALLAFLADRQKEDPR